MNLTRVNGTYAKELYENLNELRVMYSAPAVSIEEMRNCVLDIIEPAWINATAKKRFISFLNDCFTKREIYNLCYNSVQKAMKYKPVVRTA